MSTPRLNPAQCAVLGKKIRERVKMQGLDPESFAVRIQELTGVRLHYYDLMGLYQGRSGLSPAPWIMALMEMELIVKEDLRPGPRRRSVKAKQRTRAPRL